MSRFFKKNGAVLLVAVLGALLMLLPVASRSAAPEAGFDGEEEKLAQVLSRIEGAGKCCVLYRAEATGEKGGAVVVCDGADSAAVCLRITQAVGTYTGLGSDRITILKSG